MNSKLATTLTQYFQRSDSKTRIELAREIGISRMYLYELTSGKRSNVSAKVAASIAKAIGCDIQKLF